ncbi:MAG: hypothetical protein KAX78_06445, partial [Phycisphaerae bacterium]|nr:hypothetical protein [Phycisphaerae bacterium]
MKDKLEEITKLDIYEASICETPAVTYFLGRRGSDKLIGCVGDGSLTGTKLGELDGKSVVVGPTDHANAVAIRSALGWTGPKCTGLVTSVGLGDRLGLATPGHIQAVRGTSLAVVLAQQSIREMVRTQRTAEQVMDAATWGVVQEGFRDGFGSDADHLQKLDHIDTTVAAGFTMFTIDPGLHVVNEADELDEPALAAKCGTLDFDTLECSPSDLRAAFVDKTFPLKGGGRIKFDELTFLRATVKYGGAIAHTVKMYR